MDKFKGKRAFVTGGGSGIGRDIAIKLAELGAEVYAVSRNVENLKSLERENANIKTIPLDITDWDKTREVVQSITPIHLLVNNAGLNQLNPCLEAKPEEFDYSFNLNVKAVLNITQVVAKDLIERKLGGRIVNVSSLAGHRAYESRLIYASTKAALNMFTKCFALELGPHNIRVNGVSPTVILTAMTKRSGWADAAQANSLISRIPQRRFAEIKDMVNAVVYLLSDESDMVNGHTLLVDGGFSDPVTSTSSTAAILSNYTMDVTIIILN